MSDLSVKTDIAERIKARRNEIRLKQQELADKVGVSVVTISRWENPNSGRSPNSSKLLKLAEALNTSVEYLLPPEDINKEEKIKDPLLGTEYPLKKPQEYLDLGYWGNVAENAKLAAQFGTEQDKTAVLMMLNVAVNALQKEGRTLNSMEKTAKNVGVQQNNFNGDNNYNGDIPKVATA